jgi:hypothetical protein
MDAGLNMYVQSNIHTTKIIFRGNPNNLYTR